MLKDATLDLGLGPHIRSLLRSLPLGRLIPVQCHLQWQGLSRSKRSETAAGHGLEGLSVWVLEFQVVVASGLGERTKPQRQDLDRKSFGLVPQHTLASTITCRPLGLLAVGCLRRCLSARTLVSQPFGQISKKLHVNPTEVARLHSLGLRKWLLNLPHLNPHPSNPAPNHPGDTVYVVRHKNRVCIRLY